MTVLSDLDRGVATLTLHRPESRNALTTGLLESLAGELERLRHADVRAVILAGSGGTFCAGADLKEFADSPSSPGREHRIQLVTDVITGLRRLAQPSIAVVAGPAYGAGWGLALACDLTVASSQARFSLPEVRKGLRLPSAITQRLARVVGPVKAAEIILGGDVYDARQGIGAGWVNYELPDERSALEQARTLAGGIAASEVSSVANVKQLLRNEEK